VAEPLKLDSDGSPLANLTEALGWLAKVEADYVAALKRLADAGASPEQIAQVAIEDRLRRFVRMPGNSTNWGATSADFGRAAVEALRATGYLMGSR
jgi:hypothetical protein